MKAARSVAIALRHPRLRCDRAELRRIIRLLDQHADQFQDGCPPGELSIVLLTDGALADLHATHLGDPAPTDVITFASPPGLGAAGEICASADRAAAYARAHRADFSAELTLYVIHGWLHLAGYDDLQPAAKRRMRAAEARARRLLAAGPRPPVFALRK